MEEGSPPEAAEEELPREPAAGAADTPLDLDSRSAALRVDAPLDGLNLEGANLSLRAATWEEDRGSGLLNARSNASGHSLSATAAKAPDADGFLEGAGLGGRHRAFLVVGLVFAVSG